MQIEKIEKQTKQKIKYFETIDSTHLHAKEIEKQGDMILIAERQTDGIGTKGRTWHTGINQNIAMTIIKHPKYKLSKLEGFTIKVANEIRKAIKDLYSIELDIKEPNDLILNNKKICGILTEVHTQGDKIEYLLISIGFNVNQDKFIDELKDIATSLKKEYKKEFNREEIIINIIKNIDKVMEQL